MGDSLSTFLAVTQPAGEAEKLRKDLEKLQAAYQFEFDRCEKWVGIARLAEDKLEKAENALLAIEVLAEDHRSSRKVDPVVIEIRDLAREALGI